LQNHPELITMSSNFIRPKLDSNSNTRFLEKSHDNNNTLGNGAIDLGDIMDQLS